MAIAFDSIQEFTSNSMSFTVPASNPVLLIGVDGDITNDDVTGITVGGNPATFIGKVHNLGTNGRWTYLYGYKAPPTGAQTVIVTGTLADGFVIAYTGANQSTQFEGVNTNSVGDGSTSMTVAVTTSTDNDWVTGFFTSSNGNAITAGSGATSRSSASTCTFLDSNAVIHPAGSFNLNSVGAGTGCGIGGVAVGIVPTPPVTVYTLSPATGYYNLTGESTSITTYESYLLGGIFSLIVSPSMLGESASGLVMEAQNSYGLTPVAEASQLGVLIDNEPSSMGQDSYYSAWSNGASLGGIDYNDTRVWNNFEPMIETDMIPTGTNLEAVTFGQIEYKLDRALSAGDQIRLSFRTSLSDSYTVIGTSNSTTATLSEKFISDIRNSQWVQFKVEFAGAIANTSFVPLREIRLHFS